jgi:presenilin-like A22 family membrane protease
MKHHYKVTLILICMFIVAQIIGLVVINAYHSPLSSDSNQTATVPFGMEPPPVDAAPGLGSIILSFVIAIVLIILLMKFKAATFLRLWFFIVVTLAIGIVINIILVKINPQLGITEINIPIFHPTAAELLSFIVALPLAYSKIFRRDMIIHNLSELLIYPGISVVFIPILSIWSIAALLVLISLYDMYAVWHSGFMQKMAKYQINELKFFAGFFVPYVKKDDRIKLEKIKHQKLSLKGKHQKMKNIKVHLAILGGGDVVFPIIAAGVVFMTWGLLSAIMVTIGATIALSLLLYYSQKGKFYPAMPFITAGCLLGMLAGYLIHLY